MNDRNFNFKNPKPIEYPEHCRLGMGTENVAPFLRAMVQMLRPNRILEVGAGYTTPFLLEGLVNNERVLDDGNLYQNYIENYQHDPKLIIIDDMSIEDIKNRPEMSAILSSKYVEVLEGAFQGKSKELIEKYGSFDFVWFDCGGPAEYEAFFEEYWDACSHYIFCHFTYLNGRPNKNLDAVLNAIRGKTFMIDIVEPHKKRQGSITIIQKECSKL